MKQNHRNPNLKKLIPLLLLIVILFLIAFYYWEDGQNYTGVVEASILSSTSEISGKILELPVELGQHVSKGDLIARIDDTDQKYAYDQLALTLEKKKLALAELQTGSGNTQVESSISIAQSQYQSAVSANQKAEQDYSDAQSLYDQGAIPKDALDLAKVARDAAANALFASKAQLDLARNGSSAKSIEIEIQQTESQLAEMRDHLKKFTMTAAADGVIMSKSYVPGDFVTAGYHLADIALDGEKYFVFYLPVESVNEIDYDQHYTITSEGQEYDAVVKYIDVNSEYTPKDMQSTANKNKKSIKVKLLLPVDCPLKPTQEAELNLN